MHFLHAHFKSNMKKPLFTLLTDRFLPRFQVARGWNAIVFIQNKGDVSHWIILPLFSAHLQHKQIKYLFPAHRKSCECYSSICLHRATTCFRWRNLCLRCATSVSCLATKLNNAEFSPFMKRLVSFFQHILILSSGSFFHGQKRGQTTHCGHCVTYACRCI